MTLAFNSSVENRLSVWLKQNFSSGNLLFETFGKWVRNEKFLELSPHITEFEDKPNHCEILSEQHPVKYCLTYLPPDTESSITLQRSIWSYSVVLRGEGEVVRCSLEGEKLLEYEILKYIQGGIIPKPMGQMYRIRNSASFEPLILLDFYYPNFQNRDNTQMFEPKLSSYVPFNEHKATETHVIIPIIPKPSCSDISSMITAYYEEQASEYDDLDSAHSKRSLYLETINSLVGNDLKSLRNVSKLLEIACGTGRRAIEIRDMSGLRYEILGVDISQHMCNIAALRGIEKVINSDWTTVKLEEYEQFDAATFLYSFGHISSHKDRVASLRKVGKHLKLNAPLYLDVFNIDDQNEWGKEIKEKYIENDLGSFGYDVGDVFYKKINGKATSYLRYFGKDEICDLLTSCDFLVESVHYVGYAESSGKLLEQADQGKFFIKALNKRGA
jgi:ubiquinone/menaquinone biosynthesis C-methylase UbiE